MDRIDPWPSDREQMAGNWSPERYAWERGPSPVRFPRPVPFVGSQGFFEVSDDLISGYRADYMGPLFAPKETL
jgi:hypothetical protein